MCKRQHICANRVKKFIVSCELSVLYHVPLPATLWVVPTHLSSRHSVATVTLRIATTLSMYLEAADKVSIKNKQMQQLANGVFVCFRHLLVYCMHYGLHSLEAMTQKQNLLYLYLYLYRCLCKFNSRANASTLKSCSVLLLLMFSKVSRQLSSRLLFQLSQVSKTP